MIRQVSVGTSRRKVLLVKDNSVELQLDCHLILNVIYLSLGSVGLKGFSIKERRRCYWFNCEDYPCVGMDKQPCAAACEMDLQAQFIASLSFSCGLWNSEKMKFYEIDAVIY